MNRFGVALQRNWDWRAAGNFVLGGTGSGLLLTAAIAGPSVAVLVAIAFMGAGLSLVWLELGRPWRATNVFLHAQTSWMTRESMAALIALPLALASFVLGDWRLLAGAGVFGLVFLYCQARIIRAAKGIPAWREPAVVPLLVITGLAEGGSVYLILAVLFGSSPSWLPYALIALFALRGFVWHRYRAGLVSSGAPDQVQQIWRNMSAVFLVGSNLLPALLLLLAVVIPSFAAVCAIVGGCAAIFGGWQLKFQLITRAAFVQGYAFARLHRGHPRAGQRTAAR